MQGVYEIASAHEMMSGTMLSPAECREVVQDPYFGEWERELDGGNYKSAAALIAPSTLFGKRLTRAWIFFRQDMNTAKTAAKKLNPDDKDRPRLDAALLRMSQLPAKPVK